jgi:hypothetical protein
MSGAMEISKREATVIPMEDSPRKKQRLAQSASSEEQGSSGALKTKKRLPKNKRKQQAVKAAVAVKRKKNRDFSADFEEYLELWERREEDGSEWKFNKVLQAWALDNCFRKKKIEATLFKSLIPYLLTVQGGAADRLTTRAASILSTDKEDVINDDGDDEVEPEEDAPEDEETSDVVTKSMMKRAKRVQKALNV